MLRRVGIMMCAFLALAAPAAAQTLRIATQSPFVIDPHFTFLGPDMAVAREIYDSFVGRDAASNWVPGLAVSWTMIDDHTWEFKLRDGVTFSDGTKFNAADVAFSLHRIATLTTAASYLVNLRSVVRTDIIDDHTVRIVTDRANAVLPGQLTNIFIVSEKIAHDATTADFQSGHAAIGTGPFKVVSYSRGVSLSLARNDSYWGPKPAWAEVRERVITNDAARVAALLAGDADLIDDVPPTDAAQLAHTEGVRLFTHPSDRVMYLNVNVRPDRLPLLTDASGAELPANPLRDQRVRNAISLGIDRTALATRAFDGQAVPTGQLVPAGFGGYDPNLKVPAADPAGARKLLAAAGYPDGFGMTIACTNDRYVADARVCQVLGQMLERAGFHMKVETQPGSILFPRTRPEVNEMPLVFAGQSNSASRDPTHVLSLAVHSYDAAHNVGESNRGGFSDAGLDQMIDDAVGRTDPGREDALHAAMMRGVELGAIIPLYAQVVLTAARNGFSYEPRMDEQTVAQQAK